MQELYYYPLRSKGRGLLPDGVSAVLQQFDGGAKPSTVSFSIDQFSTVNPSSTYHDDQTKSSRAGLQCWHHESRLLRSARFLERTAPWWLNYLRVLRLGVYSKRVCINEVFIEETTAFSGPHEAWRVAYMSVHHRPTCRR